MRPNVHSITGEAVAGLLWMHLDIPRDARKAELEQYAGDLVSVIRITTSQAVVERKIASLQVQKLCRPLNLAAVSLLAKRSIAIVRAAGG